MEEEEKAPGLSAGYNENVLVLLVQNPNVVFTYLELSENFWGVLMEHGQPVLRLYDVTGGVAPDGRPQAEVVLPPFTANWYFRDLTPGRTYTSEFGWRDGRGLFVSLLRSNPASTPANQRVWTQAPLKTAPGPERAVPALSARDSGEDEEKDAGLPSSYSS
ncbi:MAG: DUF4912 domain-containing protein [Peptococcaceae bacterium]|jgi:hypothetical protein|nr:DUF4912 domain-containing protein [Peptococcaceae bacterium]